MFSFRNTPLLSLSLSLTCTNTRTLTRSKTQNQGAKLLNWEDLFWKVPKQTQIFLPRRCQGRGLHNEWRRYVVGQHVLSKIFVDKIIRSEEFSNRTQLCSWEGNTGNTSTMLISALCVYLFKMILLCPLIISLQWLMFSLSVHIY